VCSECREACPSAVEIGPSAFGEDIRRVDPLGVFSLGKEKRAQHRAEDSPAFAEKKMTFIFIALWSVFL